MATRIPAARPASIVLDDTASTEAAAADNSLQAAGEDGGLQTAGADASSSAAADVAAAVDAETAPTEPTSRPRYEGVKPPVYRDGGTYLNEV